MVSWSALGRSFGKTILKNQLNTLVKPQNVTFSTSRIVNAGHGHKTMALQPSR